MERTRIIVAGCGFAGSAAVATLSRIARGRIELVAIDKQPALYNYPVLPRLLVESVPHTEVEVSFEQRFKDNGVTFLCERITEIDAARRRVRTHHAQLTYDYLVLGLGSRALPLRQDPGVFVYYPKSSRHLDKLQATIARAAQRLEQAQSARVTNAIKTYRLVVVGGGLTGVEFAGALREAADRACSRLGIRRGLIEIAIYERSSRLGGAGNSAALSKALRRELVAFGVTVCTDCNVEHIAPNQVATSTGAYPADSVVCCCGSETNRRWDLIGASVRPDGFSVDRFLRHREHPTIYPVGDNMLFQSDVGTSRLDLRMAHRAVAQGKLAAQNIGRSLESRPLRAYRPRPAPTLAMIHSRHGVLCYGGIAVSGRPVQTFKRWLEGRYTHR